MIGPRTREGLDLWKPVNLDPSLWDDNAEVSVGLLSPHPHPEGHATSQKSENSRHAVGGETEDPKCASAGSTGIRL